MNISITKNIEEANCITHAGTFHADEIFASIILSKILPQVTIIRVNEIKEKFANKYIYDIGGGELDHHQIGGNGERENGVKYAACGLVWRKFGIEVLKKYDVQEIDYVWKAIDKGLVQVIDANDNGQFPKINIDYSLVNISKIISYFNPEWDEEIDADSRFLDALNMAELIFNNTIKHAIAKSKAKSIIEKEIEKSENGIMILKRNLPWKEFLIESENEKSKNINFVVFPSNRGGFNTYAVPVNLNSFENRKEFPNEWAGLRDEKLQKITGVKTARFCHNACFICSADTEEDAIKLAKIANSN